MRRCTLEEVAQHVGRRIALLRRRKGLSQEELAEKAKFSARYLQSVESGNENLTLESLVRFANLLKVQVEEFFAPEEPARPRR
jgi:transcriptional regulator with XRE-family HTH domain